MGGKLEKKSRLDEKRLAEKKKEVGEVQCARCEVEEWRQVHRIRGPVPFPQERTGWRRSNHRFLSKDSR